MRNEIHWISEWPIDAFRTVVLFALKIRIPHWVIPEIECVLYWRNYEWQNGFWENKKPYVLIVYIWSLSPDRCLSLIDRCECLSNLKLKYIMSDRFVPPFYESHVICVLPRSHHVFYTRRSFHQWSIKHKSCFLSSFLQLEPYPQRNFHNVCRRLILRPPYQFDRQKRGYGSL